MIKIDPILFVKEVEASTTWYQQLFGWNRAHGGKGNFAVLVSEREEVMLCLHAWDEHGSRSMADPRVLPGNGLVLYFRTDDMEKLRQRVFEGDWRVEEDIHISQSSLKKEFSLRDPDGYYLTITEFHCYDG